MKRLSTLFATVFLSLIAGVSAWGQTTIAIQDFETTPATPTWTFTNTGGSPSTANGAGDTPPNQRIRSGSRSFQVNNATATLNFANVAIPVGYSSVQAIVHLSSTSGNNTNGADSTDNVLISVSLNGGAFPATPDITLNGSVAGATNARWSYNSSGATTTAGTPITVTGTGNNSGGATNAGTIYSTLVINIPSNTTSVGLRIIADNDNVNEFWNVDDVELQGVAPSAAGAMISGRVLDSAGNGIKYASVTLTGGGLSEPIVVETNDFGYYNFADLPAGGSYVVSVQARRYFFSQPSRVINLEDNVTDANFVGDER